mgnify:CR=1 FL=1
MECLEYREEPDDSEHNRTEDCEDCRRSECPIPLSAPPLISYEPVISSRSITIAILMIAYLITVGSVVKKVMKNPLPSMNITLTQPVKIQLKSIQSLNTFLHLSN